MAGLIDGDDCVVRVERGGVRVGYLRAAAEEAWVTLLAALDVEVPIVRS